MTRKIGLIAEFPDKGEIVLNQNDTKKMLNTTKILKGMSNMKTPTKQAYEAALKTVKKYEDRQLQLARLGNDLSYKLSNFEEVKFKINKKTGEVIFSGLHKVSKQILIGKTICDSKDEFEPVIGKLIAVKKALGESVEELVNLVEPKSNYTYIRAGSVTVDGNLVSSINAIPTNTNI